MLAIVMTSAYPGRSVELTVRVAYMASRTRERDSYKRRRRYCCCCCCCSKPRNGEAGSERGHEQQQVRSAERAHRRHHARVLRPSSAMGVNSRARKGRLGALFTTSTHASNPHESLFAIASVAIAWPGSSSHVHIHATEFDRFVPCARVSTRTRTSKRRSKGRIAGAASQVSQRVLEPRIERSRHTDARAHSRIRTTLATRLEARCTLRHRS